MSGPTIREEHGATTFDWGAGLTIEARHVVRGVRGVRATLRVVDLSCENTTVGRGTVSLDDLRERGQFLGTLRQRDGKVSDWDAKLLLVTEHLASKEDEAQAVSQGVLASEVTPVPVRWTWQNRMPAGRVQIIGGDPDLGKSMVTCDLAARVSVGGPWPDGAGLAPRGRVLMLSAEDNIEDTIVPRLQRHDADLGRIRLIGPQDIDGYILPDGLDSLEERICELQDSPGDPVLVILDPLEVFIGAIDTHKSAEVRAALAPLEGLAQRTRSTIDGISHLNKKSTETTPLYRFGASLAFVAASRSALLIAYHPEDADEPENERRRVFVTAKGNLGPKPPALVYRIVDPGVVKWEGTAEISAYQLLAPPPKGGEENSPQLDEAKSFLCTVLAAGALPYSEIEAEAKSAGISTRTLRRAKEKLGIQAFRRNKEGEPRGTGSWYWKLCDHWPAGYAERFMELKQKRNAEITVCLCCEGPAPAERPDDGLCSVCRDGAPWQANRLQRWKSGQPKEWDGEV